MVRQFTGLFFGLMVLVLGMAFHYFAADREVPYRKMADIATLTGIVSPVLSAAYYEPRLLKFDEAANPAYPEMPAINHYDFVYEK